jgi:hypothetical protein
MISFIIVTPMVQNILLGHRDLNLWITIKSGLLQFLIIYYLTAKTNYTLID